MSSLPLLLLILAQQTLSFSDASVTFIRETCRKTPISYSFCVAMFESDKRSLEATTVEELATISLEMTEGETIRTYAYIKGLVEQNPGKPQENPLKMCLEAYRDAIFDLRNARLDMNSHSYAKADGSVIGVYNASRALVCQDVGGSSLALRNMGVLDHLNVCVSLIDSLY